MERMMKSLGLVLLTLAGTAGTGAQLVAQEVLVTLREQVSVSQPLVRLSDVADVEFSGPSARGRLNSFSFERTPRDMALLRQMRELDLAEFQSRQALLELDQNRVAIRIQLAGIDPDYFQLRGAASVRVAFRHPLSEQSILTAVRQAVAEYLGLPESDIMLELTGKLTPPTDLPWDLPLTVRAEMNSPVQLDRLHARVSVFAGTRLLRVIPVTGEVKIKQPALVATRRIAAGEAVTRTNSTQRDAQIPATDWFAGSAVRRVVHDRSSPASSGDGTDPMNLLGMFAVSPMLPGDVIRPDTVSASPQVSRVAIAARDKVRLVAQRKGLTVTLHDAEALEKGAVGDTIRVRNPASGRVVLGRISPTGDVIVTF